LEKKSSKDLPKKFRKFGPSLIAAAAAAVLVLLLTLLVFNLSLFRQF